MATPSPDGQQGESKLFIFLNDFTDSYNEATAELWAWVLNRDPTIKGIYIAEPRWVNLGYYMPSRDFRRLIEYGGKLQHPLEGSKPSLATILENGLTKDTIKSSCPNNSNQASIQTAEEEDYSVNAMIGQPEDGLISLEQLDAKFKGTYAELVIEQPNCIERNSSQDADDKLNSAGLDNNQWNAVNALHNTLLHEYHDLSTTIRHSSAIPAPKRFSSKHGMLTRTWRGGTYSSLNRLPRGASLDHELASPYFMDSMMGNFQPDSWPQHNHFEDDGTRSEYPLCLTRGHEEGSWRESGDGQFRSLGYYPASLNDLQSERQTGSINMPQQFGRLFLSVVPPKFFVLAALTAIAVPVVSAELDAATRAWVYGILANVPSVYFLASAPVSSSVDSGVEDVVRRIAGIWGRSLAPVFVVMFIMALRDQIPGDKQEKFILLVFGMSVVVMLVLKMFMLDDTWGVLDLVVLCVSFCGITACIICYEPMDGQMCPYPEGRALEEGHLQPPQTGAESTQPTETSQVMGDDSTDVQQANRNHDLFAIGDDSSSADERPHN